MSSKRPKLEDVKKTDRGSLVGHKGFIYSSHFCLGKGSFGNVYLGWSKVASYSMDIYNTKVLLS